MATEIWRDFDPNLDIPKGLKNARVATLPDREYDLPQPDALIDFQTDTLFDDGSELDEEEVSEELGVPGTFTILSQTLRTADGGQQVVDVVIEVEDILSANDYDVRVTK